ncbi:RNA polymerase sigma factor [Flavobacterium ardleyense]|uniref:RNA polymerase sigma factor n=1 Tax=Flavobacterium ardleyense TaxID=2038737 RepID=UPI00298CF036|nr:RNA polymerase sigma factor [Flavobacterium ardleyense]
MKDKNVNGFNYLYDNYSASLYGVILRIVIFKDDADEVLQDVFVKIWNSSAQYDVSKGTLYTWMLNIARNSAIDKLKSKNFQNNLKNQSIPDFVSNHSSLAVNQTDHFNEIQNIVNKMKDDYKDIIIKSYFEGYTQQEISDNMNIPLGTVKTRTRSAFVELRKLLKEFKL